MSATLVICGDTARSTPSAPGLHNDCACQLQGASFKDFLSLIYADNSAAWGITLADAISGIIASTFLDAKSDFKEGFGLASWIPAAWPTAPSRAKISVLVSDKNVWLGLCQLCLGAPSEMGEIL